MAENTIRIETDDIPAATGFEQRLQSLTSVLELIGPQFRQFGTALRNAVDNARKFGASIGALGALAGAAIALRKGLQWLN